MLDAKLWVSYVIRILYLLLPSLFFWLSSHLLMFQSMVSATTIQTLLRGLWAIFVLPKEKEVRFILYSFECNTTCPLGLQKYFPLPWEEMAFRIRP